MEATIFHGVNNSLYFRRGDRTVIVDGIHQGWQEGFSSMHPSMVEALRRHKGLFRQPELVLFTHLHTDHYDRSLLLQAMEARPIPRVYGPGLDLSNVMPQTLGAREYVLPFGSGKLLAQDTVHEGEEYQNDRHQTFLLELDRERFFLAGDAILREEDADRLRVLAGGPVAAAFLNVYQLWSPVSVAFLRMLAPERIFLNHMPFPEDDRDNLYGLARQVVRHFPANLPRPLLLKPMNWVDLA